MNIIQGRNVIAQEVNIIPVREYYSLSVNYSCP